MAENKGWQVDTGHKSCKQIHTNNSTESFQVIMTTSNNDKNKHARYPYRWKKFYWLLCMLASKAQSNR